MIFDEPLLLIRIYWSMFLLKLMHNKFASFWDTDNIQGHGWYWQTYNLIIVPLYSLKLCLNYRDESEALRSNDVNQIQPGNCYEESVIELESRDSPLHL